MHAALATLTALTSLTSLAALSSLAACTGSQVDRGASPAPVAEPAPAPPDGDPAAPAPGAAEPAPADPGRLHTPGGPKPGGGAGAGVVDQSCATAADCAVKNVGNCCGYYPACVNKDSATYPEQVKADCQARGLASVCGFAEITACACVQGRCAAGGSGKGP